MSSSLNPANTPYVAFQRAVSRRRFLAGTGVLLALPMLDAMTPAFAAAPAPLDQAASHAGYLQ